MISQHLDLPNLVEIPCCGKTRIHPLRLEIFCHNQQISPEMRVKMIRIYLLTHLESAL